MVFNNKLLNIKVTIVQTGVKKMTNLLLIIFNVLKSK